MKIRNLAVGAWATGWGALMIVNGILGSLKIEVFSLPVFEAMVGLGLIVTGASYFNKDKE
jgi:hypothetical protein